jgi:histidine triad (HIT) family protein
MEDSIFTRIIKGEIPAHKVYEDDKTLAFLDIHPIQPGHVLVVPKIPAPFLWDMDEENYQALMAAVKKVGARLREVLGTHRVGVQVVGLDVAHAHVHIVPFNTIDEYLRKQDFNAEPDHAALAAMAERVRI